MLRPLLVIAAIAFCAPTIAAAPAAAPDAVVLAFEVALTRGEAKVAASLLGETLVIADQKTNAPLAAHLFREGRDVRRWPGGYLTQAGPHRNEIKIESVSIQNRSAVVVTSNRGSNRFRHWKDERLSWLLGETKRGWRIVGMIYQDIQLPQ